MKGNLVTFETNWKHSLNVKTHEGQSEPFVGTIKNARRAVGALRAGVKRDKREPHKTKVEEFPGRD